MKDIPPEVVLRSAPTTCIIDVSVLCVLDNNNSISLVEHLIKFTKKKGQTDGLFLSSSHDCKTFFTNRIR